MAEADVESNSERNLKSSADSNSISSRDNQVTVVTERLELHLLNTTKRGPDGQALPKPHKASEDLPSVLNPIDHVLMKTGERETMHFLSIRKKNSTRRSPKKKKSSTKRESSIADDVLTCNVLFELGNASCGLTLRQILREDTDEAKK